MYYSGESNVPGAPGNFGNGGDLAVHPQPIDQRARDLMNLQQQNPELYQRLLNEKKVEGFAQPGGIPGMPGNQRGMQIAGSPSFTINESAGTRKIRGIRNLSERGVGGERDTAVNLLKQITGPQLPPV